MVYCLFYSSIVFGDKVLYIWSESPPAVANQRSEVQKVGDRSLSLNKKIFLGNQETYYNPFYF